MPKYLVRLSRLVREETTVSVEAESKQVIVDQYGELFDFTEELDMEWPQDYEWGSQKGDFDENNIDELEDNEQVDYVVDKEGVRGAQSEAIDE